MIIEIQQLILYNALGKVDMPYTGILEKHLKRLILLE